MKTLITNKTGKNTNRNPDDVAMVFDCTGMAKDIGSVSILSGHLAKQMSLRSLAPMALIKARELLKGSDVAGAAEQMNVLVEAVQSASLGGLLPDTALPEYRLLKRELASALKEAGRALSALSPLTAGIDGATYDLGEHARYDALRQLQGLLGRLREPVVNGYA